MLHRFLNEKRHELREGHMDRWVEVPRPFWISRRAVDWPHLYAITRDRSRLSPRGPYEHWLTRNAEGEYRKPETDELHFAAAIGVWGGHSVYARKRPDGSFDEVLLGRGWNGFDGSTLEYLTVTTSEVSATGIPKFPWFDPPLVWMPPEH